MVAEDATWLRKNDYNHINVAELDAVLKGINLAIKWGQKYRNKNRFSYCTQLGELYSGGEWKNTNKKCWRNDCKVEIRDPWS